VTSTLSAMKPRIRMVMVADGDATLAPADGTGDALPPASAGRFHALAIIEGVETGDKRLFTENSLTWRDLPLPVMAQQDNTPEHMGSVLIGNIDKVERQGTAIHVWGDYLSNPDDEQAHLIGLVQSGELRGVSADIDDVEFEILFPLTDKDGNPLPQDPFLTMLEGGEPEPPETETIDGVEYEVMPIDQPLMRVTEGRLMGITVLTFPALQEAFIEDETTDVEPSLAASAARVFARNGVTGVMLPTIVLTNGSSATAAGAREATPTRFEFPVIPPREWFEVPEAPGEMPLTILDSGQVFGHLATWGECHIGIMGECVQAPPSPSNYARFHVGEIPVDDGGRVSVGRLTFHTGHADRKLGAGPTQAHYDNSGSVAADLRALDGEFGIWVCGAARSTLTLEQVREVMSTPPSGDWRLFGNELDMVAALSVPVPGFNVPRAWVRKDAGLVASLIISHPAHRPDTVAGLEPGVARKAVERIAASVGRSRHDRIAALRSRVHPGGE